MKHFYYYGRDISGNKKVTVCLTHDREGNRFSAGMAVCSPNDNFDKKRGRRIARGRAIKALHGGCFEPVNRWEAMLVLTATGMTDLLRKAVVLSGPRNSIETKIIKQALVGSR